MKYSMLLLVLVTNVFFIVSCGETTTKKSPADELAEEVMAIHDEAMPLNPKLIKTAQKLKPFLKDSLLSDSLREQVMETIEHLEMAEEGMMSWMNEYRLPSKSDEATLMSYLKKEKTRIEAVQKEMNEALEEGTRLFDDLSNKEK